MDTYETALLAHLKQDRKCEHKTVNSHCSGIQMSHPLFLRVRITHTNDKAVIYNYILYYIQENYTL